MQAPTERQILFHPARYKNDLAIRLKRGTRGELGFDAASRARYACDAGGARAEPAGVLLPRSEDDVRDAMAICRELGVGVTARGAGTSYGGQALGSGLVVDCRAYLNRVLAFDAASRHIVVQPGLTLDRLDAFLRPHGLWFPVPAGWWPQATLGGLIANGAHAPGMAPLAHALQGIDFLLADGTEEFFGPFGADAARPMSSARSGALVSRLFEAGAVDAAAAWTGRAVNLAHLLIGSQGRLAFFLRLHLRLAVLPPGGEVPPAAVPGEHIGHLAPCPALLGHAAALKAWFDPQGLLNPGPLASGAPAGGRREVPEAPAVAEQPAALRCDQNGACLRFDAGAMCASHRVTGQERDSPRGRANTIAWALRAGDGLADPAVRNALDLCVGCKACRSECPQSVDIARSKIEALHRWRRGRAPSMRERLFAYLPRYAPRAARFARLLNGVSGHSGVADWMAKHWGLATERPLPHWRDDTFFAGAPDDAGQAEALLFVDTWTNAFEPEVARAAWAVMRAAGTGVHLARPARDDAARRPLCCGRSFLALGMVEEAVHEARRLLQALGPYLDRGIPVVGLEPACLFTMRDEYRSLPLGDAAGRLAALAMSWEEWLVSEQAAGRLHLTFQRLPERRALLHGHCHQTAFGATGAARAVLEWIPGLDVETTAAGCCGMAGHFGYEAEHYAVSMQMGELGLLPAVRAASIDTLIVADGASCRGQIAHGAAQGEGRRALHVAQVLERALSRAPFGQTARSAG